MEGCPTITWCPVSFWMVNVSGADHLKAHGSSDVCSELTLSVCRLKKALKQINSL